MTPHDPDRDVDALLGKDGGEIGDLYRRLPRYEPPRRLDRAVLSEAARAVHSGKPPRRQRWIVGVGSAAGLVLAAGIAWRIGHDAMRPADNAASTKQVVPVQPISEPVRAKRDAPAPLAAPAESDAAHETEPRGESQLRHRVAKDEIAPAKAKTPRQAAAAAAAPEPPKPAPVAPAAAPPAPQAFPAAPEQRERAQVLEKSSGNSASAAGGVAADAGSAATDQEAPPATARRLSSPTSISGSVELRRDTQLAPEDWLAHIRQLRRQGRTQQASESLRLFARSHPDWTIPDELLPLLK